MKKHCLIASLLLLLIGSFLPLISFAQKEKVEGIWYNEEKTAKVEIYKAIDHKYWGKIVWLKEPVRDGKPRTDIHNPKKKLQNTPLIGLPILRAFVKDGDKKYTDGEIYDPKNGKTYSCTITQKSDNVLSVRGYVGISLLGRTTILTRSE